jgi:hypothetical protein
MVGSSRGMVVSNPGDLMYYGVERKYSFMKLINSKVIDPSLHVGGGYTFLEIVVTLNPGAGLAFWFTDNVGLSLATTYKKSFKIEKMLMAFLMLHPIFKHTAGLTFKFGGKDTDGDGIYKDDACPDVAGLKNSTVVLILMETIQDSADVQTYLV